MLRPPMACSTFGVSDRIRVPGPAAKTRTAVSPRNDINSPLAFPMSGGRRKARHAIKSVISRALVAKPEAPSPGLEPELSEPKSEVLPITPRRIAGPAIEPRPTLDDRAARSRAAGEG